MKKKGGISSEALINDLEAKHFFPLFTMEASFFFEEYSISSLPGIESFTFCCSLAQRTHDTGQLPWLKD
jgi:hypothetical protein